MKIKFLIFFSFHFQSDPLRRSVDEPVQNHQRDTQVLRAAVRSRRRGVPGHAHEAGHWRGQLDVPRLQVDPVPLDQGPYLRGGVMNRCEEFLNKPNKNFLFKPR